MTDTNAPQSNSNMPPSHHPPMDDRTVPPPPPPRKKKKRWWLRILLTLIILIVALVALAPYIASSGPVRGIVVSKINQQLDGSIEIADYSIGWTGGISASGIKVYDDRKNLVIEVPKFSTDLSLINAAKQNFDLGKTSADVKLTVARYADGTTSLDHIAKPSAAKPTPVTPPDSPPQSAAPKAEEKPAGKSEPISIPNVRGDIALNILGGTLSGEGMPETVTIDPSTISLNIPDINQAIKNAIALKYRVGNAAQSTITIDGSASAIQNNKLDIERLKADQTIKLANVNLGAAAPFAKKSLGPDSQIGGIANGDIAIKAEGMTGISSNGQINIANLLFAGGGLHDVLKLDNVAIPLQVTRTVIDANNTIIKIEKLGVNSSLANIDVTGQVQEQSLMRLGNSEAPGADGSIVVAVSVPDFGKLSRELPNTAKLAEGVVVNSGSLATTSTIKLTTDRVMLAQKLDLTAEGTRDGKPIRIQPVHLDAGVAALPNGKPIPTIRDLTLALTSSFATLNGGGESLAALGVTGNFDLKKLFDEAGQFVDVKGKQLAGTGTLEIKSKGDPSVTGSPIEASVTVNLDNVVASGIGPATTTQPIQQSHLAFATIAKLTRDATNAVTGIETANVSLQTGSSDRPLVDVALNASNVDIASQSVGAFELSKLSVNDLSEVQKQFGAFIAALKDQRIKLESGAVYANVSGAYDGKTKTLTLTKPLGLSMPNLVATKAGKPLIGREDITGKIGGTFVLGDTATSAKFTDFWLGAKSGLFSIGKSDDAVLDVTLPKVGGGIKGNGKLNIAADLKRLNDLSQNLASTVASAENAAQAAGVVVTNKAGDLRSGMFNGTLALAHGDKPQTDVTFDGTLSNLSVTTNDKPIESETAKITLIASSPDDLTGVNVARAGIESRFATANVTDAVVKLGGADIWNLVQSVTVKAEVPDLPTLAALLQALAPSAATPATPTPERSAALPISDRPVFLLAQADDEEPAKRTKKTRDKQKEAEPKPDDLSSASPTLEPLAVTSGSASLSLDVKRDAGASKTTINLTDMVIHQLAMKRGSQKYAFSNDINLKLNAAIEAAADPSKPTQPIAEQIRAMTVSQLSGDLGGVAKLSMPAALSVKGPLSKPAADGQIKLDGTLDALTPLLAVLQGAAPLPYSGDYSLVQKVSSSNGDDGLAINLEGSMTAEKFTVLDSTGKAVFTDAIEMKNSIGAYLDRKAANIRTLKISMPQSNALNADVVGRVNNWDTNRQIRDFKVGTKGDLAQLWKIVQPMLSPEMQKQYASLKTEGKNFNLSITAPSTAFPAKATVYESMKSFDASGSITGVEYLDTPQGLTVQQVDIPFEIKKGAFAILEGRPGERKPTPEDSNDAKENGSGLAGLLGGDKKPSKRRAVESDDEPTEKKSSGATKGPNGKAPAPKKVEELKAENGYANTGAINLAGITVDLTSPNLTLSIPKNKQLLQSVRLNPVLADTLGSAAPVFIGSDSAKGLVNVKILECRNLALGDLAARNSKADARLVMSVDELQLNGALLGAISAACNFGPDGIQGRIPDSTVTIANGVATSDITILIDREGKDDRGKSALIGQPIKFAGGVRLSDLRLSDFMVNISAALISDQFAKDLPNGISIPLKGYANKPEADIGKAIAENAVKNLIPDLIGGKKKGKDNAKGDDDGKSDNPIGDILDGLGGKKKDKDGDRDKGRKR